MADEDKTPAKPKAEPKPKVRTLDIRECPVCHRPTALATCPTCGKSLK